MTGRVAEENILQVRLNELFASPGARRTNGMVARGLQQRGYHISEPYISQLRTGVRGNPSTKIVLALAEYFEVEPGYFFSIPGNGDPAHTQSSDGAIIQELADCNMKQLLSFANGLSEQSLEILHRLASGLRESDKQ